MDEGGIILLWIVLAIAVGIIASQRGQNGGGWFVLAILITPLIAGIILFLLPDKHVELDVDSIRGGTASKGNENIENRYSYKSRNHNGKKIFLITGTILVVLVIIMLFSFFHKNNTEKNKKTVFEKINIGTIYFNNGKLKKAKNEFDVALQISKKWGFVSYERESSDNLEKIHNLLRNSESQTFFSSELDDAIKNFDRKKIGRITNILGEMCNKKGNYVEAIKYYKQALQVSDKMDIENFKIDTLNKIADIYKKIKEYSASVKYYDQMLRIIRRTKNSELLINSLKMVSNSFKEMNLLSKSNKCLEEVEHVAQNQIKEKIEKERLKKEKERLKKKWAYQEQIRRKTKKVISLNVQGWLFYDLKRYSDAVKSLKTAFYLALSINRIDLVKQILQNLIKMLNDLGRYSEANIYARELMSIENRY